MLFVLNITFTESLKSFLHSGGGGGGRWRGTKVGLSVCVCKTVAGRTSLLGRWLRATAINPLELYIYIYNYMSAVTVYIYIYIYIYI